MTIFKYIISIAGKERNHWQ